MTAAANAVRASRSRGAIGAMWAGLGLTLVATVYPFLDRGVLAAHIQAGYPSYSTAEIDAAAGIYLMLLATVGVLGVAGWGVTLLAASRQKSWARWAAAVFLVAGLSIALSGLTIQDTSGEVGLAPLVGWLQALPCAAGLIAITQLWRR